MQARGNRQTLDYFKIFKILDLKKLDKHGQVKLTHDKTLGRKILSVEGNVSTQNYITLDNLSIANSNSSISFSHKYLYIVGLMESSKNFCFQLTIQVNSKSHKLLYSTVYKTEKQVSSGNITQVPLMMKSGLWTYIVIDLHQLCQKINKGSSESRLVFRLLAVELRAHSKIKNIYQSDYLFGPSNFPKDMELPLKNGQEFYQKYNYVLLATNNINQKQNNSNFSNKIEQMKIDIKKEQQRQIDTKNMNPEKAAKNDKNVKDISKKTGGVIAKKTVKIQKKQQKQHSSLNSKLNTEFQSLIEKHQYDDDQIEEMPRTHIHPRPQITIVAKLVAIEGSSMFIGNIIALEAFIISPTIFPVHKPIKCLTLNKKNIFQVALGYNDGSISLWDIIRQKSLCYLKTDLKTIKSIQLMENIRQNRLQIYVVGIDSKKREIISIISQNQIICQKTSTFPIDGIFLPKQPQQQNEQIIISYGYENIRIWKQNKSNNVLNGVSLYLGKMNIKVTYRSCCQINQQIVYIIDNSGYLTKIDFIQQKTLQIKKISQNQLDHILNIQSMNKIIIIDDKGTCRLLDYQLNIQEQYQFGAKIRNVCYRMQSNNAILKIQNYNKCLAEFNISQAKYTYLSRSHTAPIIAIQYVADIGKIVSIAHDNTIRIWQLSRNNNNNNNNKSNNIGLQWSIKQQYQFLIQNGQAMTCLAVDQHRYAYVAMNNGKIRKIDLIDYQIVGEVILPLISQDDQQDNIIPVINTIEISRNGKNLLFCAQIIKQQQQYAHHRSSNNNNMEISNKIKINNISSTTTNKNNNNVINTIVVLTDANLKIINRYQCPKTTGNTSNSNNKIINSKVMGKFNKNYKKLILCWTYGSVNRIQTINLNNYTVIKCQFYLQLQPTKIFYQDNQISIYSKNSQQQLFQVYNQETGQLQKVINLLQNSPKTNINSNINKQSTTTVQFPYLLQCNNKDQLSISTVYRSSSDLKIQQKIDLPEQVTNIKVYQQLSQKQGSHTTGNLVICSGTNSYGLYAIQFQVSNLKQFIKQSNKMLKQQQQQQQQMMNRQVQNQFMMKKVIGKGHFIKQRNTNDQSIKQMDQQYQLSESQQRLQQLQQQQQQQFQQVMQISRQPKKLIKLYQKQQQMFEQVADTIYGNYFNNKQQQQQQTTNNIQYNHHKYTNQQQNNQKQQKGIKLIYGWDSYYPHPNQQIPSIATINNNRNNNNNKQAKFNDRIYQRSKLIWQPEHQSLLLYSRTCKSLILHHFKQPVSQKIVGIPIHPSFITKLQIRVNGTNATNTSQYIGVGLGNQLKIYDSYLNYNKTLLTLGEQITGVSLSVCGNFVIVISKNDTKLFIQVMDMITGNTISTTYLELKSIVQYFTVMTNPFQTCLEFVLISSQRVLFYRLTSILTLQLQQLEQITKLINNNSCGQIICAQFIKLQTDGQQIILLGTYDGSIVVVDARAAQILILCKKVMNRAILSIMHNYNSQQQMTNITIVTHSNTITTFTMTQNNSLSNLINILQESPTSQLTIDSEVYSHSQVYSLSGNSTLGMLAISKFGVLWLVDLLSKDTIKILSTHSQANINDTSICSAVIMEELNGFITGANDGCVKFTSFGNLEQENQIYKPKRKVKDLLIVPAHMNSSKSDILVTAFNSQIYFYQVLSAKNMRYLGSVNMSADIVSIKNIPYSDNFIVCTSQSLLMMHVNYSNPQKLKVQLKQICDILAHPIDIQVHGYNLIMVRQLNKVDIWLRKQKRNEIILKQLSENIQELRYYMMDSNQCAMISAYFVDHSSSNLQQKISSTSKQYVACLAQRSIIQYRDFEEHVVIREIQLGVDSPTTMSIAHQSGNNLYYIGNQKGVIYLINENGLQLEKLKVLDGPVKAIQQFNHNSHKNRQKNKIEQSNDLLIFGRCVVLARM